MILVSLHPWLYLKYQYDYNIYTNIYIIINFRLISFVVIVIVILCAKSREEREKETINIRGKIALTFVEYRFTGKQYSNNILSYLFHNQKCNHEKIHFKCKCECIIILKKKKKRGRVQQCVTTLKIELVDKIQILLTARRMKYGILSPVIWICFYNDQ